VDGSGGLESTIVSFGILNGLDGVFTIMPVNQFGFAQFSTQTLSVVGILFVSLDGFNHQQTTISEKGTEPTTQSYSTKVQLTILKTIRNNILEHINQFLS
jgi:hypothetical protein